MSMVVLVNGERRELSGGATVATLVGTSSDPPGGRGVAVAVDGQVIPRSSWESTRLSDGARVEILVAVQGG